MSDLEGRVIKLEVTTDNHADEIEALKKGAIELKHCLDSIEKTLTQIKYLCFGAAIVIVAKTIGADKFINLIFGIH